MTMKNSQGEERPFFGSDRFEAMSYFLGEGRQWNGPFPQESAKL